jgi:DNA replication licensing factor MCM6
MQTYIKFCRTIKPRFTQESAHMLKEEFKRMRQNEKNGQRGSAYKITVRQLESLIRLSEGMARAHCDHEIKPIYVREVCRLMRNSNINIVKGDIEFADIQEEINREREEQKQLRGGDQMDLDMQNAEHQQQINQGNEGAKKVKISFDEFRKLSLMIISIMKDFERKGEDNVRQGDIVDLMIQKIELESNERQTSMDQVQETTKIVSNVISHLINNENILMITQEGKNKVDRYLTLNDLDMDQIAMTLQGGNN